jgi:hypothetical protein
MAAKTESLGLFSGALLAFQAAGLITDYRATKNNQKLIQQGRQLEQAAIETNLEAVRLESGQASLDEMKQLRQNLGTQIAMQAARGNAPGAGTALTLQQESVSNFNADERTRRMNLIAKESQLRASNILSGLHTLQSETQLGQAMTSRMLNTIPLSSTIDEFRRSKLGKQWGFGFEEVK